MEIKVKNIGILLDNSCFEVLKAGQIHIWKTHLDRDDERLNRLRDTLSNEEHERANRYHFDGLRHDFIVARGLLREVLSRYLNQSAASIHFEYNVHGKPYLTSKTGGENLHFNISHSHRRAVFAVSNGREVGVDIEWMGSDINIGSVSELVLSEEEKHFLNTLDEENKRRQFFQIWTLKEAYFKAQGCGLTTPLFEINTMAEKRGVSLDWALQPLPFEANYAAALCLEN